VPPSVLLEQLRGPASTRSPGRLAERVRQVEAARVLRRAHGSADAKNKITLTRKQTARSRSDATGKYRTVQVEVRKKRVFVKRDPNEVTPRPSLRKRRRRSDRGHAGSVDSRERELREEEARRQQQLAELQAAELPRSRSEKKEAEQKREAAAAAQPPRRHHASCAKPASADAKATRTKKAKTRHPARRLRAPAPDQDPATPAAGWRWHSRGGTRHRGTRPGRAVGIRAGGGAVVRDIAVPETITWRACAPHVGQAPS